MPTVHPFSDPIPFLRCICRLVFVLLYPLLNMPPTPHPISSSSPFLLLGIPIDQLPLSLLELSYYFPFTIVYTDNLGPHRKLLPLLAKKWHEDCLIVTFDDENQRGLGTYLRQSLKYYTVSNGQAIVSLRARKMGFCDVTPYGFLSYNWYCILVSFIVL